jgi:hypothetical protein
VYPAIPSDLILDVVIRQHDPFLDRPREVGGGFRLTTPGLIQPISGIRRRVANLLGNTLPVLANLLEKSIPLARLGHGNAVAVTKSLELTVGPGVEDPVLGVGPGALRLVVRFIPSGLDALDQRVASVLGIVLGLNALLGEVARQRLGIPAPVRLDNVSIPVFLD